MQSYLESRLPDYLGLLERLTAVNSFTTNAAGVEAAAEVAREAFAGLGFAAEWAPAGPGLGRHLFLHRPGAGGRHVAFVSHSDTVFPPEEEAREDFVFRREGDRLTGPGTADIKGGTVVALMVLDALRAVRPRVFDAFSWLVALDACEEQMTPAFARLCRDRLPAGQTAAILVMECGKDDPEGRCPLVVCRKGMVNFRVVVSGKAAHSGTGFWRGRNAILDAARLALALAEVSDRDRHLTVNVGVVQGGTVTNRVPHECVLSGEVRAFSPEVLAEAVGRLRALVEAHPSARADFTDELSPWGENAGSRSLLEVWQRAGAALGVVVEPEWRGGLSDGNLLWSHAPTLDGLGPAGGNCHCSQKGPDGRGQEYAVASSFVRKALLTAEALAGLAGEES
jgi:glutamate carboxypeptidase